MCRCTVKHHRRRAHKHFRVTVTAAAAAAVVCSSMAAVRSLRVSVKSDSGSESDSDSESDRDAREAEPMEVEEGELEAEDISVNRSLKELLPVSVRTRPDQTGDWSVLRPAGPREVSACGNGDSRLLAPWLRGCYRLPVNYS